MNWAVASSIGEVVGSIAVVISLVYVALQIGHANKQSEIDSLRHTWDGLNQICDRMSASKEMASIINRGRESFKSLDDDERLISEHIHLRLLNTLESWYLQVMQTSKPDWKAGLRRPLLAEAVARNTPKSAKGRSLTGNMDI